MTRTSGVDADGLEQPSAFGVDPSIVGGQRDLLGISDAERIDRARGALLGLAWGEALGLCTVGLPRDEAQALLGPGAGADATQSLDTPLRTGTITDRALAWRPAAVASQASQASSGTVGVAATVVPGAVAALAPENSGGRSAAWLVPLGLHFRGDPLEGLAEVVAAELPGAGNLDCAAAAAVVTAVSAILDDVPRDQVIPLALAGATYGARLGRPVPGPDLGARLGWAVGIARASDAPVDVIDLLVGTSPVTQEVVPAAFSLAQAHEDDVAGAVPAAAALGGASDVLAAIVGALLGARCGVAGIPSAVVTALTTAHPDLLERADALVGARCQPPAPA